MHTTRATGPDTGRVTRLPHGLFGLALVVAGVGLACDDNQFTAVEAELWVYDPLVPPADRPAESLTQLDLGPVPLGGTETRALGLSNRGGGVLAICVDAAGCAPATRFEPPGDFAVRFDGATGRWTLSPGAEQTVSVELTPTTPGPQSAVLVIEHDGAASPTRVTVTAQGVAPDIDFSSTEIDFGPVTVGQRALRDVTLRNDTPFDQPIYAEPFVQDAVVFGIVDPTGRALAFDEALSTSVPANEAITLQLWFQPDAEGVAQNALDVRFCPACTQQIRVRGVGVKPAFLLEPASLSFGRVPEGQRATQTFDVVNIGTVDLEVQSLGVERGTSEEFMPSLGADALPVTIAANARRTVEVAYEGSAPGEDRGRIEVVTNAWEDTENQTSARVGYVSVDATATGPNLIVIPPQITFGVVPIDGRQTRVLALQNAGNEQLTVSEVSLAGSSELSFEVAPSLPTRIAPGDSLDLIVVYIPTDAGLDEGTVTVRSDDRNEPSVEVPIAGVGGVPTTCAIAVAPSQVTFGLVERGRVASLPVEIRNAGVQPCSVTNIGLDGDSEFSLTDGVRPQITVAPGAVHRVTVAYRPVAYGNHNTRLVFDSDDPAQGRLQVPISGASAVSSILVVPSTLDFNVVPVTCYSPRRTITVYNTGASPVIIANVYLDASTTREFDLVPVRTPLTIAGGDSLLIDLYYRPQDIGQDTGLLFISHSAATVPVAVPLAGDGRLNPTVTDTYQQLPTPQADVLFVVDDSGSMSQEQRNLGTNLASFISFAQQQGIDYQIAVTTTDTTRTGPAGRFVPLLGNPADRIITPQTPDPSAAFLRNTNVGTTGSGTERGLEAAYLALSDPLINTHNAGFLRAAAALAVIFVSDESDFSARSVNFYENFLRNIKGFQNTSMLSISAVVGTQQPRCTSNDGTADYAPRYITVANNTGGVTASICTSNWGQALSNIGLNSFGLRRQFNLSSAPVPATVAVAVNGVNVGQANADGTENWRYDAAANTVSFLPAAVPPPGATITVTYTVSCLSGP